MLRLFAIVVSAVLGIASAGAQGIPADVSTRVGRAASFIYGYTPSQYANELFTRDVVWDNRPTSIQGGADKLHFPSTTFSSAYTAVNRVPSGQIVYGRTRLITACGNSSGGGCTLAWFQTYHPTWIIYTSDQLTPAYQFEDPLWIPLDISNPDVQSWIKTNLYHPILSAGYQAISVDNVTNRNDFKEIGVCSIAPVTNCTSDGGTWTKLYSGVVIGDPVFKANRLAWAREITRYAHSLGKSSIGNVVYDPVDAVAGAALVNAFDIWFDEPGITGDSNPSACNPRNLSSVTGADWIKKVDFIVGLNAGAGPKAYVSENSICPAGALYGVAGHSNFEVMEFAVASYLIYKNSHTYLFTYFDNGSTGIGSFTEDMVGAAWPHLYLEHGEARGPFSVVNEVYTRSFANVVALVNPSRAETRTYDLGSQPYSRFDCSRHTGVVSLPPLTAMVLLKSPAPGCQP